MDEEALRSAVATQGPVSVLINANDLQHCVKGMGIYKNTNCSKQVNHAVLVVGYGTEKGVDYWIVKNSWSTRWGDDGYIKMIRNVNICGIAYDPVLPLV